MRARTIWSARLYGLLLLAYSAEFRREYGSEMAHMFGDQCREEQRHAGARGLAAVWARAIWDVAVSAPVERMDTFWQDLKYGARTLWHNRAFSAVAIVALALGAGVNTAIFSIVDGVLLRPLPFADSGRLVAVETHNPLIKVTHGPASMADFEDWRAASGSLADMAAFETGNTIVEEGGEPERVPAGYVTERFFPMFGVTPIAGRTFTAEEEVFGGPNVAVLGRGLWQRRFGGDPSVVGRTIALAGRSVTVVGIVADTFEPFVGPVEVWRPLADPPEENPRDNRGLNVVGRLAPGASMTGAESELRTVSSRLEQEFPKTNAGWGVDVIPLSDAVTRDVRPALLVLFGAVTFVVLIACANVSNLLLARGAARQREIAMRAALGATRLRVARQLLTESVLLYVLGGIAGLAVAYAALKGLIAIAPAGVPRLVDAAIDARVLAFTFGVSIATGVLFGLTPAIQSSKADLNESLKEAGRGLGTSRHRNRARSALVVSEIALAFMLLVGAGLFVESFARLRAVNPGFEPTGAIMARVALPGARYGSAEASARFYDRLLERVATLPGVTSAGVTSTLPLEGEGLHLYRSLVPQGRPETPEEEIDSAYAPVSPDYFRTMQITVLGGRGIAAEDREDTRPVVVVNETLARRLAPDGNAVGMQVRFWHDDDASREVVGVVADVKNGSLGREVDPASYVPFAQDPFSTMIVVARTNGVPSSLGPEITSAVRELDPGLPTYGIKALEGVVASSTAPERFQTTLLAAFAAVALLLAMTGVYAVMWYGVAQRRHEIGIRVALGARPRDVVRLVVGQGVGLALVGVAIGAAGALALGQVVASLLFGTSATNPLTLVAGAVVLLAVTALASFLPARKAAGTDPLVALRSE